MGKQSGKWIESRRCHSCNPLIPKEKKDQIKLRLGFVKDLNETSKWVPCMGCNNKGYITKSGILSS